MKVVPVCTYVLRKKVTRGHLVVDTSDKPCAVRQQEEHDDMGINVGFIDNEDAKRCVISGMVVGNVCSLHNCNCMACSEKVEREGVLMVKFQGKFVPIEQDEPFEGRRGTGKMKQNLTHFRSVSTGDKMCVVRRKIWYGEFETGGLPAHVPSAFAGLPRGASPSKKMPLVTMPPLLKKAPPPMCKDEGVANFMRAHPFGERMRDGHSGHGDGTRHQPGRTKLPWADWKEKAQDVSKRY